MKYKEKFLSILLVALSCMNIVEGNHVACDEHGQLAGFEQSDYKVIYKPAVTVIGIESRTSNAPDQGPKDIANHWARFFNENIYQQIPNKSSEEVLALYCDYEGDYTKPYSLVIGCPVNSIETIPEGMVAKTIPSGTYAVFNAKGEHPKTLIDTWAKIWATHLERTYTGDFEVYGEKFISKIPKEVDVFIAIHNP